MHEDMEKYRLIHVISSLMLMSHEFSILILHDHYEDYVPEQFAMAFQYTCTSI